jgi:hypothetical protein
VVTLVEQRVFGIALGYEDLVDYDQLRHDPAMAVLAIELSAGRKDCAPLAGKSTLSQDPWRLVRQAWPGWAGRIGRFAMKACRRPPRKTRTTGELFRPLDLMMSWRYDGR